MRLLNLICLVGILSIPGATAQNRKIEFESTRSWPKIVEKAKAEEKIIFVDCYAEWCGPCKALDAQVFTQDKVADFFNANFVNAKLDMEKDADGRANAQAWGVTAFPTLMFIDPQTGEPVHKIVGARDADGLLTAAETALDPGKRLASKVMRYNDGERDPLFLMDFIATLHGSGMQKDAESVAKAYITTLTLDEMTEVNNWLLILQFENDPLSETLRAVRENKERFYSIPVPQQRDIVNAKLASATVATAIEFATTPNLAFFDQPRYEAYIEFLNELEGPEKEMAAIWINTSMLARQSDWSGLLEVVRTVNDEQLLPPQLYTRYFQYFISKLAESRDKKALEETIAWFDETIAVTTGEDVQDYVTLMTMNGLKGGMFQMLGKSGEANKAMKEMQRYQKLLQDMGVLPQQ